MGLQPRVLNVGGLQIYLCICGFSTRLLIDPSSCTLRIHLYYFAPKIATVNRILEKCTPYLFIMCMYLIPPSLANVFTFMLSTKLPVMFDDYPLLSKTKEDILSLAQSKKLPGVTNY